MELPVAACRQSWFCFETMGLTREVEVDYVRRLRVILFRRIFNVPVLDFDTIGMLTWVMQMWVLEIG